MLECWAIQAILLSIPISTSEGCTRLWKPEIRFDGIFEGLGVQLHLLLYTEPREDPKPPEGILVAIPDFSELSRQVFRSALNLAERSRGRRVTVLHVQTTFAEAKEKALGVSNGTLPAEETLESWLREEDRPPLELDYHLLRGNTGSIARFVNGREPRRQSATSRSRVTPG